MTYRARPPTMESLLAELSQRVRNLEEAHLGHTTPTGQWLLEERDGDLWRKDTATGISYPVPLGVIARSPRPGIITAPFGATTLLMRAQNVLLRTGHSYRFEASVRAVSGGAGDTPSSGWFKFAWTSLVYTNPTTFQWSGDVHIRRGQAAYYGGRFTTWYDHTGPTLVVTVWLSIAVAIGTTSVSVYCDTVDSGLWVMDDGPTLPASLLP